MIELTTADGGRFEVRPMVAADGDAVRRFFGSLSAHSTRMRFFSPSVNDAVLERLASVEPEQELVLLAFDRSTGGLAGAARATRRAEDPTVADLAITVGDAYQRRGLGRALLGRLRRVALQAGIDRFGGHVLTDNGAARSLVARVGATFRFDEAGVLAFDVPLRLPASLPLHLRPAS